MLIIIIGLIIIGISGPLITIPGMIDFMDIIKLDSDINENSANDTASGIII